MGRRWVDAVLVVVAGLSVAGFVRSVWVVSPAAADLPEPLRSKGPRLAGYRSLREPTAPARVGRDLAWGPIHGYQLVPAQGHPVRVELVVRRSRDWEGMALPDMEGATTVAVRPDQRLRRGKKDGREVLQTCLVGRGVGGKGASALVDGEDLVRAVARWRDRLDRPASREGVWLRKAAVVAGLRVSERWECLLVTLKVEGGVQQGAADGLLLGAWRQLYPQLAGWGETWESVNY
jgi:hypothetical protein